MRSEIADLFLDKYVNTCVYLCIYMLSQFPDQKTVSDLELKENGSVLCLCTPVSPNVPEMEGISIFHSTRP